MLAIVGSRDFQNYDLLKSEVNNYLKEIGEYKITTIVSGGAPGTDQLAERFAKEKCLELQIFRAEWGKFGPKAGPLRNTKIVKASDFIIAFPSKNGKGTQDTIKKALDANIPIKIYWID